MSLCEGSSNTPSLWDSCDWFLSTFTQTSAMLISSCVNGIRVVSGLISAVSCCCDCPLILAQRLPLQQLTATGCVISLNTWCPWICFLYLGNSRFWIYITEPLLQMAKLLMGQHSRWWSLYKEDFLFSLHLKHFNSSQKPKSVGEDSDSYQF